MRELRNVVEQVVNLGEEALPGPGAAPGRVRPHGAASWTCPSRKPRSSLIEGFERDYLKSLIERCEGNISRAAREADIDRVYLRKLLRKHGLDPSGDP